MQIFDLYSNDWPHIYYNRAADLQGEARFSLGFVYLLLVIGGLLFYYAQVITDKDFSLPDITAKKESFIRARSELSKRLYEYEKSTRAHEIALIEILNPIILSNLAEKVAKVEGRVVANIEPVKDGKVTNESVAEAFEKILRQGNNGQQTLVYRYVFMPTNAVYEFNDGYGPIIDYNEFESTPDQIHNIAKTVLKLPKFEIAGYEYSYLGGFQDKMSKQIFDLSDQIDVLHKEELRQMVGLGPSSPLQSKPDNPSVAYLVQTTVTRFGGLAIISFIVLILISIYRYNMRLAAYYIGRGDAIKLIQEGRSDLGFVELAASLTPTVEYGKAPSTPIEQIIELMKIASKSKEKD